MRKILCFLVGCFVFLGSAYAQNPTLIYSSNGVTQSGGPVGKVTLSVDGSVIRTNTIGPLTTNAISDARYWRKDVADTANGTHTVTNGGIVAGTVSTGVTPSTFNGFTHYASSNQDGGLMIKFPDNGYTHFGTHSYTPQANLTNNILRWGTVNPDGSAIEYQWEGAFDTDGGGTNFQAEAYWLISPGSYRYDFSYYRFWDRWFERSWTWGTNGNVNGIYGTEASAGTRVPMLKFFLMGTNFAAMSPSGGKFNFNLITGSGTFTAGDSATFERDVTFSRNGRFTWQNTLDIPTNYTASSNAGIFLAMTPTNGAITVTIPDASGTDPGRILIVQDANGSSSSNTITVSRAGQVINGMSSVVINEPFGHAFLFNGGNQFSGGSNWWAMVSPGTWLASRYGWNPMTGIISNSFTVASNFNLTAKATTSTNAPALNTWIVNGSTRKEFNVSFTVAATVAALAQIDFYHVPSAGITQVFGTVGIPAGVIQNNILNHSVYADPGASYMWSNSSAAGASATIGRYFEKTK